MGRVVRTVAIGIGLAAAALVTGGAALIAGASVFAAVSIGATMALTGAQYLMRSNTTQPSGFGDLPLFAPQQQGPPPTPLSRTIRQADCPRSFIFGRTKTSGAYFFYESDTVAVTGPAPTTNADSRIGKFIYTGIYICDGPIDGFDGILCDDEAFTFGSTGVNRSSNTPDGNDAVFIPQDGIKFVKTPNYTISSGYWAYINGYWIWIPTTSSSTYTIKECALIAFEPVNATEAGYNSYTAHGAKIVIATTANGSVTLADRLTIDQDGSVSVNNTLTTSGPLAVSADLRITAIQYSTAGTGSSIALSAATPILIHEPAAAIAALTINFPASPVDGQVQIISFVSAVTTLTWTPSAGTTIASAPGNPAANTQFRFIYRAASLKWYRI